MPSSASENPKIVRIWNRALVTGSLSPHSSDDEVDGAVPVSRDDYCGAAPVPSHGGSYDGSSHAAVGAILPEPGGNVASPHSGKEAAGHVHCDGGSQEQVPVSDCGSQVPVAAPLDGQGEAPVASHPNKAGIATSPAWQE